MLSATRFRKTVSDSRMVTPAWTGSKNTHINIALQRAGLTVYLGSTAPWDLYTLPDRRRDLNRGEIEIRVGVREMLSCCFSFFFFSDFPKV